MSLEILPEAVFNPKILFLMNAIEKLTERFRDFPGIGGRQSKRFVYFLLSKNRSYLEELSKLILDVKKEIYVCPSCFRFFPKNGDGKLCRLCSDLSRDKSTLLLVEKDIDLENVEKTKIYKGGYFVLGGSVPILDKKPEERVRIRELFKKVKDESEKEVLKEIIIAFSVNAEGENTSYIVEESLGDLIKKHSIKISRLGRGLSTGSELEYVDGETLKGALSNRY